MRCTSFFSPRRARAAALALCTLALPTHLVGQQPVSIPAARTDGALPRIRINGVHTVRSLAEWPGISLKVEQASHVVVFAVTRGREDVPLQVLSPRRPGLDTHIRAGRTVQARPLGRRELLNLVNYGEAPLVVAFASSVKPNLDPFRWGPEWATDMRLDTLAMSQEEMVDILGKTVFGADAEFSVAVATASNPTPLSRYAESWYFDNGCTGYTNYYRRSSALGWFGASMLDDPLMDRYGMWGLGISPYGSFGLAYGVPYMFHGAMFSLIAPITLGNQVCTGYRVAWWPTIAPPVRPPAPVDSVTIPPGDTTTVPTPQSVRSADQRDALNERTRRAERGDIPTNFEPSAWRRGETGNARRFPGVIAEERPWNANRALPSRSPWSGTDAAAREGMRRSSDRERSQRANGQESADAARNASTSANPRRAESPTRGREFPTDRSAGRSEASERNMGNRRRAESPTPRPESAPAPTTPPARADGTIIPPPPAGQSGSPRNH